MRRPLPLDRILPWVLRAGWIGVLVFGGAAVEDATADRSSAVRAVATFGGATLWLLGVAAMVVPAAVSLTATRVVVPVAIPAAVMAWAGGADPVDGAPFVGIAVITAVVALSGDVGRTFVQASAYGDEDRHLLRPPAAYAAIAVLAWALWASCLLAGPFLLAARQWALGGVVAVVAAVGAVWLWPRWHVLSRRWFVLVPAGVVVHDHLVLAETLMLRRHEIAAVHLAPADTAAADLTGPAAGHAIEIVTREAVTAIVGSTPGHERGSAIHLTACLVGPTRPGKVLLAARSRRLPVG